MTRSLCIAAALLTFAALAGTANAAPKLPLRAEDGSKPNVLLLTIDTLRMDHLGAYGYRLPTSPAIDRFAREGVLFTDAITPVPTTAPAMASLFTGQYVNRHHVHQNAGTFSENVGSLAEAFAAAGYDTAGFYGNEALEEFGRGFAVFEEFPRKLVPKGMALTDDYGAGRALKWLKTAKEPWFLWLHFIDPHGAYDSSPPEVSAGFEYPKSEELEKEIQTSEKNWVYGEVPRYQGMPELKTVGDYVRRYDGEIVGSDLQVSRLRAFLEAKGELDHTLIVLTSDHGESLGEDNYYFQHGTALNESSLRVPLLIRHADLPSGKKVDAPVSLIDLYPTIAKLAGLPEPKEIAGRDVTGTIYGEDLGERLRITYTITPDLQVSILRGPWRLLGRPVRKDGATIVNEFAFLRLSDITTFPEKKVRLREQRATVEKLKKELVAASEHVRDFRAPEVELTDQQIDRLRALGYME